MALTAGVGAAADDLVSDVIARHLVRMRADPPATFATPDAYQHLRASLLVSVRNAARNWLRDNRRTVAVDGEALLGLIGASGASPLEEVLFDDEDARALREAVARLAPAEARVAQLLGVEEYSTREAARMLGVPKSTVQDAWIRAQRSIRLSVDRYLDGGYCKESSPYLALLDAQRRAEGEGSADRPLDDALGPERAAAIARHVYGTEAAAGGCPACRLARARERAALRSFLPPLFIAPPAGRLDALRDTLVGIWDGAVGALGRFADDATGVLVGAGGGAAGLGGGKAAALLTSATLAVGASSVAPRLVTEHASPRPARVLVTRPAPAPAPTAAVRPKRASPPAAQATPPSTTRSAARRASAQPRPASGAGSAVREFTPGP